jgi:hypothetical protein
MPRYQKTPFEKMETKINNIVSSDPQIVREKNNIKIRNKILFYFSDNLIKYTKRRFYPLKKEDLIEEDFYVEIPLNHDNLNLLSSNSINPPMGAKKVLDIFRSNIFNLDTIIIGSNKNQIVNNRLYVTKDIYDLINRIDKEESSDKKERFYNRIKPFIKNTFNINIAVSQNSTRNYSLLLKEIIESGELAKEDLIALADKLTSGETNQIIIEKQINKQVEWLIDTIEKLLEDTDLNIEKVKNFGQDNFNYSKASISGPEHLIEKILTDFGQFTLFGVPALLNTNKYILGPRGQSNSQFDLILITHLGDIEVVELKRTDELILSYDSSRNKFYPSKSLSIAIAQAERYISSVIKDNDEEYKIEDKKIRDFINEKIGGTTLIETIRPTALILIGSWLTLSKQYSKLNAEIKSKITENDYNTNSLRTFREIKNSYRNIKILNYSELLEHARTRLEILKEDNN